MQINAQGEFKSIEELKEFLVKMREDSTTKQIEMIKKNP
jgi:hypothetical protein